MFIAAFARFARRYAAETRGAFAIMFALLAPASSGAWAWR
jgi:Flp pilus assembly protein TadG